jgi:polyisoprenoid-binding protein YceI
LAAWRSAGYPVEGVQPAGIEAARLRDGNYAIDRENSRLEWIGRNINNRHCGRIAVRGGELIVSHEIPVRGRIEIDMTAISNLDLQEEEWRDLLIRHLRSDDFFDVDRFPAATFELTGWESLAEASPGAHNGIATGSLTIKDTTLPITFQAIISPQEDGSIKAHALFEIDRALWNVCYGSGKLYERLGMHFVHDLVTLELFIVAK